MLHSSALLLVGPLLCVSQAFDPQGVPELAGAFETLFELSDWDGNGEVTYQEILEFERWTGLGFVREPKPETAMAELFLQGINRDELKEWSSRDLAESLAALDVDGSGMIEKGEPTLEILCRGEVGTRGVINRLALEMLLEEADRDVDGVVTADEMNVLEEEWAGGAPNRIAAQWVANAKRREPANRNRMAPGVAFFTLEAELDLDRDGWLDKERFRETFRTLDADGDGALTRDERRHDGYQPPEESWRMPDEARLKQPALMPWQRSLNDALAVQKRTGQALLICVNMDGETACDSLASWRYRDPGFAKVAGGYVCLVVSPDDHQPRDYDDRGRRLVSPRLGRVTDSEHIDLEVTLFERYFNQKRVAPRHLGVDVDGTILFDLYLSSDPSVLDATLAEHSRPVPETSWAAMSTEELAGYRDAGAREEVERRALEGDPEARARVARISAAMPDAGMLCLRDEDVSIRKAAALAMAQGGGDLSARQVQWLLQATARLDEETRQTVANTLWTRIALDGDLRTLGSVRSLYPEAWVSSLGAVEDWQAAASLSVLPVGFTKTRDAALNSLEALDALVDPADATVPQCLLRAQALLDLAHSLVAQSEDPRDAAAEAIAFARRGTAASPARAQAIIASSLWLSGDHAGAAQAARMAMVDLWPASSDPLTFHALKALQSGSTQVVYDALMDGRMVSPLFVADALLAGRALVAHPAGTETEAIALINLVETLGDVAREESILLACLGRFPASAELHQRYRNQVLRRRGAAGMWAAYDALEARAAGADSRPTLTWFRGLAMLVSAEWETQQGGIEQARVAYAQSLESFGAAAAADPSFSDSANHYSVLAGAASAALAAQAGELELARGLMESYGDLRPASLDLKDGLGVTPREHAAAVLGATQGAGEEATPLTVPEEAPREGRESNGR